MDIQTGGIHSGDGFTRHSPTDPQTRWALSAEHERLRHQSIMSALPRRYYAHAFEPGCGAGELTAQLVKTCGRVSAIDVLPDKVARARARCAPWGSADIRCADLRDHMPEKPVDLMVFSELGYYFSAPELIDIARNLVNRMTPGGEFIAAHSLNPEMDPVLHADAVHCQLLANLPLRWVTGERHGGLRIDRWQSS